ncbi:hypothetical protein PR202_gb17324 [Eleusine coracana subsp. coracana]|uniref:Gnk2-homologous domain-containing protein n=1 Tax=Eleusine coracana subsp. coracana TaxID=191504 RepID=A0AAV5F0C0_ELECO|nr:hypothetical protein QOZ80_6BG0467540 [Eleusine coracana subsp. coracana]GJN29129.1 hypothetical protein PR202_gb17324 [Eleusine coracana subsp. coracana]
MAKLVALPLLALMSLLCASTPARGGDDYTAFVYAGCSQARYDPGSQYAADVDTALSSLINSAAYTAYANYTSPSTSTNLAAVHQCRSDLPAAVCGTCVKSAAAKLSSLCNAAAGAAVQLRACFVRYGNDSFLGRQDTTVLFKKCGGESAADTGVVAMRDAALGALAAASASAPTDQGSYRAGAAGYVQAMSQCVGDLGVKMCTDCVSAASSQLKAGCGYASAGEVYLGKCYARFWSNAGSGGGNGVPVGGGAAAGNGGVTGGGVGGGNNNAYAYGGFVPSPYTNHDESGKTLAIIIGLVAAVAIVIVFLSFVRRAGGVGGKS